MPLTHSTFATPSLVQVVRRKNLRALRDILGSGAELARRSAMSHSQLSQLLTGYRQVGEVKARKIEVALRLPLGRLDLDEEGTDFEQFLGAARFPMTLNSSEKLSAVYLERLDYLQQAALSAIYQAMLDGRLGATESLEILNQWPPPTSHER